MVYWIGQANISSAEWFHHCAQADTRVVVLPALLEGKWAAAVCEKLCGEKEKWDNINPAKETLCSSPREKHHLGTLLACNSISSMHGLMYGFPKGSSTVPSCVPVMNCWNNTTREQNFSSRWAYRQCSIGKVTVHPLICPWAADVLTKTVYGE